MFSDDKFMTLATGIVLAIVVGTMAQNSDSLMAFLSGEKVGIAHEDQFTVRAGNDQILDVLANDTLVGNVTVVDQPSCGTVSNVDGTALRYSDSAGCSGDFIFTYCVEKDDSCESSQVALNVIAGLPTTASTQIDQENVEPVEVVEATTEAAIIVPETISTPTLSEPAIADTTIVAVNTVATPEIVEVTETQPVIPNGPAPIVMANLPDGFLDVAHGGESGLLMSDAINVSANDSSNNNNATDSSDLVVEMAAQILLPGAQIGSSVNDGTQGTQTSDQALSDNLFTANLETSTPPSEETVEVASLPATDETTASDLNFQPLQADCEVNLTTSARPGAAILIHVDSACRKNQVAMVSHSGFNFSTRLDDVGGASFTIPAFDEDALVTISFDDGAEAESSVLVRDAGDLERMAIIWSVPVNLDLHAFEDNAAEDSEGHIWAENQRRYRDTLTSGGGFLELFGDPTIIGGTMAEVYSLPTNRLRQQTIVSMDLRINDATTYCDQKAILRTIRTENGRALKREFNLLMPDCGSASAGMVLENFVDAISVASR